MDDPHDPEEVADETPQASFAAELRRLRLQAGLSVRGLAQELHGAHSGIGSVAFSPDGRTLASASADKAIRVWEKILWHGFAEPEARGLQARR